MHGLCIFDFSVIHSRHDAMVSMVDPKNFLITFLKKKKKKTTDILSARGKEGKKESHITFQVFLFFIFSK